jgi:hypothetical protein
MAGSTGKHAALHRNPTERPQLGSSGPLGFTAERTSTTKAPRRCCSANILTTYGPKPYTRGLQLGKDPQVNSPHKIIPCEAFSFHDSSFAGHVLLIGAKRNMLGGQVWRNIPAKHLRKFSAALRKRYPTAEISFRLTGFDPSQLPAEGYSHLGTLRRGGYGVI